MSGTPSTRRVACEFLAAAAVCGATYYFLVDSACGKIAAVRHEIEVAQQRVAARAGMGDLTDAQTQELVRSTSVRAEEMRARSAPAKDEAAMFSRVSDLAAMHAVRVEQLNPSQARVTSGAVNPLPPGVQPGSPEAGALAKSGAPDAPPPAKDMRIGYSMVVTGTYTDIAGFVGSLASRVGYAVVTSVRISQPDVRRPDMLRAAIETEHFALDLSRIKLHAGASATTQPMPLPPAAADAGPAREGE